MNPDIPSPTAFLAIEFDKHERIKALSLLPHFFDEEGYWKALGEIWSHNESLFQDMDLLEHLWKGCGIHSVDGRPQVMGPEDRARLAALPEEVTVWRGCYQGNLRGWSWTTSREVAEFFSGRFTPDNRPLLATAKVRKEDILAFFAGDEDEVVVNPAHLLDIRAKELPPQNPSKASYFYFLSQTGRLTLPGEVEGRAKLMAMNGTSWDKLEEHYQLRISALEHYGLNDRADQVEAERKEALKAYEEQMALQEAQVGPSPS